MKPEERYQHPQWWERSRLAYHQNELHIGRSKASEIAVQAGKPVFVYDAQRIQENLSHLHCSLEQQGVRHRILFAMKANRYLPILTLLKLSGICGVDVCSGYEVLLARQAGFCEEEVSFTGTAVSDADLDILQRHPKVWVNCDSVNMIGRLGSRCPGRAIGLRMNPNIGVGYNQSLEYAGNGTTKFGIYREQFEQALIAVEQSGLRVTGLHIHCGCGYLTPQLPFLQHALERLADFMAHLPTLRYVNIGGGMGVPLVARDQPLDLRQWSDIIARSFAHHDVEVWTEPGEYLVKDSGLLILQVTMVEKKLDTLYVGVNGGYNLYHEQMLFGIPTHIVPCRQPTAAESWQRVTIAGNINEAGDIWAQETELPVNIREGDFLAFLNTGAYGSANSSNHCGRGDFAEYLMY